MAQTVIKVKSAVLGSLRPPDLKDLRDVDLEGLQDGGIIEYDESSKKWVPVNVIDGGTY